MGQVRRKLGLLGIQRKLFLPFDFILSPNEQSHAVVMIGLMRHNDDRTNPLQ